MKPKLFWLTFVVPAILIILLLSRCTNPFMETILGTENGAAENSPGDTGHGGYDDPFDDPFDNPPGYFSVTFHSNGGSPVTRQLVLEGDKVSRPVIPKLTGFGFDGWFNDDGTFASEWDFSAPVSANLHLYAKWVSGLAVRFSYVPSEPLTPIHFVNHEPIYVRVEVNGLINDADAPLAVPNMLAGTDLTLGAPPLSPVAVNGVMEYDIKVAIALETIPFPSGTGSISINGFSDLPPGYPPYSGQIKTAVINVMDGQAEARAIPVSQANIEQFWDYASTSIGRARYYKLTEDIAMGTVSGPICTDTNPFAGCFDGGGYSLSGLEMDMPYEYPAMFACIASSGTVKNVALPGINIIAGQSYAGGIAGINEGNILNCSVSGTINGIDYMGGIAGYNNGGTIENCFTDCTIAGTATSNAFIGGIAGSNANGSQILSCYSTGTTTGNAEGVGGIAGNNNASTIQNCYSLGDVVNGTANHTGGIAGSNFAGLIRSCYAKGSVQGGYAVGGIVGLVDGAAFVNDCVALNGNISAVSGYGRVIGAFWASGYDVTPNYAQDELYLNDSPWPPIYIPNSNDGLSTMLVEHSNLDWWRETGPYYGSSTWYFGWDFSTIWDWDSSAHRPILKKCGPQGEESIS